MRPIIYPYKMGSYSAKELNSNLLNHRCKKVREQGNYKPFSNHMIINWGNPRTPEWTFGRNVHWLNHPLFVKVASNKLSTLVALDSAGVSIPNFTTNKDFANNWDLVICRYKLRAKGGDGTQLVYTNDELLPECPLYVRYEKKKHEFRVHVFHDQVIDVQQKRKMRGEEADYKIRNYKNGWVFCRQEVELPELCKQQALLAVETIGLDFGDVDFGWNEYYQRATVYEINTAPGLEGSTITNYLNAIKEVI